MREERPATCNEEKTSGPSALDATRKLIDIPEIAPRLFRPKTCATVVEFAMKDEDQEPSMKPVKMGPKGPGNHQLLAVAKQVINPVKLIRATA